MLGLGLELGAPPLRRGGAVWWSGADRLLDGAVPGLAVDLPRLRCMLAGRPASISELLTVSTGSKWICDATGALVQTPADTIAFDWSRGRRQWLLEGAATNLLVRSDDLAHSAWSKTGVAVTSNVATAPDGSATADRIVEDGSTGVHRLRGSATVSTLGSYTLSTFVAAGERTAVRLALGSSAVFGAGATADFNLLAGTVASLGAGAVHASIVAMAGGWYRCALTATSIAIGTATCDIALESAVGTASYTGTGAAGLTAWGAQFEVGVAASSYVATTSATATRVADFASLTPAATAVFAGPAAALAWRGRVETAVVGQQLVGLGGGWALLRAGPVATDLVLDGSTAAALTLGSAPVGELAAAVSWGATGRAGSLGGATTVVDGHLVDRSLAAIHLTASTGAGSGTIRRIDEIVAWPLSARASTEALRQQARSWQ